MVYLNRCQVATNIGGDAVNKVNNYREHFQTNIKKFFITSILPIFRDEIGVIKLIFLLMTGRVAVIVRC